MRKLDAVRASILAVLVIALLIPTELAFASAHSLNVHPNWSSRTQVSAATTDPLHDLRVTAAFTPTVTLKSDVSRAGAIPTFPIDFDSIRSSAASFGDQLQLAFLAGIKGTAVLFLFLGIVAYLRHSL